MNNLTYTTVGLLLLCLLPALNAQEFHLERLHSQINTSAYDELAPCVSQDGLSLYFTRVGAADYESTLIENGQDLSKTLDPAAYHRHLKNIYSTIAGTPVNNPINSAYNQDIWLAQSIQGTFDHVHHPAYPFNNALPNSANSFGRNAHELIVINQFVEGGGMKKGFSKVVRKEDGSWTFPEALYINNYHNSGADVNMTMSNDGQVIIISMERADAIGRSDLYISYRQEGEIWSTPKNLGPGVNSLWREATPHLSEDGTTLYFSSDRGSQSAGGSDIFVQYRLDEDWERWSAPQRFRSPINSAAHDSHPYFNAATGYLYFNSTRNGSSDIYRIQIKTPQQYGHEVYGRVINTATQDPLPARISIQAKEPAAGSTIYFSEDGHFRFRLEAETVYAIKAEKTDFEGQIQHLFFPASNRSDQVHSVELLLHPEGTNMAPPTASAPAPTIQLAAKKINSVALALNSTAPPPKEAIAVGTKLELAPIYFQRSYSIVLKKSLPALDQLSQFLKAHPKVSIRISGHTDNQGEERALLQLSEERAAAIKDFLIHKHGIAPYRMETLGLGGHVPVTSNTTERQRQRNRRVEVEVIKVDQSSLGMQTPEPNMQTVRRNK